MIFDGFQNALHVTSYCELWESVLWMRQRSRKKKMQTVGKFHAESMTFFNNIKICWVFVVFISYFFFCFAQEVFVASRKHWLLLLLVFFCLCSFLGLLDHGLKLWYVMDFLNRNPSSIWKNHNWWSCLKWCH